MTIRKSDLVSLAIILLVGYLIVRDWPQGERKGTPVEGGRVVYEP